MGTQVLERYPHPKYPRLAIHLRSDSAFLQAITFLDGRQCQKSLKTAHLPSALKIAADWYQKLLRASTATARAHPLDRVGVPPTMADVFASWRLTLPRTKQAQADMRWGPIAAFWRTWVINDIDPKTFREFYRWRRTHSTAKNHTIHKDVIVLRQVLKFAIEEGQLDTLPMIPAVGSITANPRPWLTPVEWKHLVHVATKRILAATGNPKLRTQRQDLLDFMWFMMATMARVDEARGVRFADCRIVKNEAQREVLVIQVTGKRGSRTVVAQERATALLKRRLQGHETSDLMFEEHHRDAFRELLKAAALHTDAAGFTRNFKSIRATAISFRLLEPNPNLLVIARNAGTSLQMIDQFYAKRLSAEMHLEELSRPSTIVDTRMGGRPAEWAREED